MKFFRIDLLTLLISLFILSSCKNQDGIGLGVDAANQLSGTLIDTSTIVTNTALEDTVLASGLVKTPLAYFKDPVIGTTEANIAMGLDLPNGSPYTLPTGTVTIDSVRLVMKYADGFYGDSLASNYKVNVYQLNENISNQIAYYNNKQWNYKSTLLGSKTFRPFTHTSPKIYDNVVGKPDTLKKVSPQVRINIDPAFINSQFFGAGTVALGANNIFANNIKGLYLTMDKAGTTGTGGAIMFTSADSLTVYYRANNGGTIDTNNVSLPASKLLTSIKHTYSTAVQTELSSTTTSRNTIYLQGLAGLRAKIAFPYIKNLIASVGTDIVLNRAELVISATPGSNIPFVPLPKLTMYRLDLAKQRGFVEDASGSDPRGGTISLPSNTQYSPTVLQFGGFYLKTKQEYHFVITAYIEDLIRKRTIDYGTYIAPVDTTNTSTVDIAPTPQVAARTIAIGGADKTSPYRMKLNIIYTKLSK